MKRNFIFISLALLGICCNVHAMEEPHALADVREKITDAFQKFGISAKDYSVNVYHPAETPVPEYWRWNVFGTHIEITQDIRKNPDLVDFTAYCAAADVKNHGYVKSKLAVLGSYATAIGAPVITRYIAANHPNCCSIFFASCLPLCALAINPWDVNRKIFNAINTRFAATAFTQACKKLVEEKKFKTLATYYAFAKLIKHAPLTSDDQFAIIHKSLRERNYSIESIIRSSSVETTIVDNSQMPPAKIASAFYPSGSSN